ncbi:MAG TPA: glycoside hydrolase family 88 protein [Edaphobacter sp.]|nr:glycoside hydrolase family 88 protein [Edaphobacter sp.]
MKILAGLAAVGCLAMQVAVAQQSPSRELAAKVTAAQMQQASWSDEGILLDGLAAEWHTTAVGQDFHFIKAAVDRYLAANGGNVNDVAMGQPVLLVYRVTEKPQYYKAAQALHDKLAASKDAAQAAPFLAMYAATFHQPEAFSGIAKALLAAKTHMQRSAYAAALVDTLAWMPTEQAQRLELISALKSAVATAEKDKTATKAPENLMLVYAVAKGVRLGFLPQSYESRAEQGWDAAQKELVSHDGGKMSLKSAANDGKTTGAFLLAGSEMEQTATQALGQGKTALVDAWFNSQTRKNAAGQTELYHYKWTDDTNNGFAFFGRAFQRYGVKLAEEKTAPTAADLKKAQIYILPSPDIPSKNPNPHYMDAKSVNVIADWVKAGGTLLLMENDGPNAEFEHFNKLSDRFGIHFNQVLINHVIGNDYPAGTVMIPAGTGVFAHPHQAYMKDTCSITPSSPAKAVVTKGKDVMIAVAKYGKGTVFAVVDPWLYNEYVDRRNHLPVAYDNFDAAVDLVGWIVKQ